MTIRSLENLADEAKRMSEKAVVAVVEAHDEHTLESVIMAANDGIITPALIGNKEKILAMLSAFPADPATYEIISSGSAAESVKYSVDMARAGKAAAVMKGRLETGDFLKALVNRENGLLIAGRKLSVAGLFTPPSYHKIIAVSDMGLNTYPDLESKKAIIQNAVRMLNALGVMAPKVAVLAAVEKLNPKMPETVDADALKRMNLSGELTGCIIEGPISFDLATSAGSARIKDYSSPVAGDADLLIVPDIVSGNILVKCLTGMAGAQTAGAVLGAEVPVIITSRSAGAADKYYSIALAACAAAGIR